MHDTPAIEVRERYASRRLCAEASWVMQLAVSLVRHFRR